MNPRPRAISTALARLWPCAGLASICLFAAASPAQAQSALVFDSAGNSVSSTGSTTAHAELSCAWRSCNGYIGGSYVAAAGAALGTGSLRAAIHADGVPASGLSGPPTVTAQASAGDTLTFHGPSPDFVDITVGVFGAFGVADVGSHRVDSELSVTGGSNSAFIVWGGSINDEPTAAYHATGRVTNVSMDPTAVSLVQHVTVLVTPEVPVLVSAWFQVQVKPTVFDYAEADFNHTAQLGVTLPAGWSFTSQSGVFLTQSPVPEPPTTLLMLAGLLIVGRRSLGRPRLAPAVEAGARPSAVDRSRPARSGDDESGADRVTA